MKKVLRRMIILALIFSMTIPGTVISAAAETVENGGDGAVTMAQGDIVKDYSSISEAIKDTKDYSYSQNRTKYVIKLNQNVSDDVYIPDNRNIEIDLNGYTLTNVSDHTIKNDSIRTTITDTSTAKTGVVDNISHGKGAVYNNINATITLSGGTYTRSQEASTGENASGNNSWYVIKNFGTMTINNGVTVKFSDSNNGLYSSLIGNGWQDAAKAEAGNGSEPKPSDGGSKATLNINGGTFTGGQITIKNDDFGILNVKGGTILQPSEGRSAIANNNVATISGGEIESKGAGAPAIYSRYFDTDGANKGEMTISNGTIKSAGDVVQTMTGTKLKVTGGTFTTFAADSYAVRMDDNADVEISGGIYEIKDKDKIVNRQEAYDGKYEPVVGPDGYFTIGITDEATEAIVIDKDGNTESYLTLSAAAKAAPAGSTVKLMKNLVITTTVSTSNFGVTVDLNGHNIDGTAVTSTNGVINLRTLYSSKPVDGIENTLTLTNSQNSGGEVKGILPVKANCGNSTIQLPIDIDDSVTLTATEGGDAVALDSSAYLIYSDRNAGYFTNGMFKVTGEDGQERIYGSYGHAARYSADGIITLLHDYTGNDTINSGSRTGTLDLNKNTYTYTGSSDIVSVNSPKVSLTIKNGTLTATSESCTGISLVGASTAETKNDRSITFENVDINIPGETYGIVTNGTEKDNSITLTNSTLNVPNGYGIFFPSTGTVTIDNSIINAKYTGVQMCAGSLKVTGEKTAITVTGEPQSKTEDDGVIADGAAISIIERDGYQNLGTVIIEDGTFISNNAKAVKAYTFNNTDKTEGTWETAGDIIDISGGKYNCVIPLNLCSDQYVPAVYDEATGMYTVVIDEDAPVLKAAGTDTAIANGGTYYGGTLKFTADDLSLSSVAVDGTEIQPDTEGVYTITGAGEHTIIARDMVGNKVEITVTIVEEKGVISDETAEVTLTNKLTANGQEQTQNIKVVVGGVTLTEGVDYQVTGNKATAAGEYTLTVTGIGNYEGSVAVKYTVAAAPAENPDPEQPGTTDPEKPGTGTTDPGSTGDGGEDQTKGDGEVSKTGDETDMGLLLTVMAASAAAGVVFFFRRRKAS